MRIGRVGLEGTLPGPCTTVPLPEAGLNYKACRNLQMPGRPLAAASALEHVEIQGPEPYRTGVQLAALAAEVLEDQVQR